MDAAQLQASCADLYCYAGEPRTSLTPVSLKSETISHPAHTVGSPPIHQAREKSSAHPSSCEILLPDLGYRDYWSPDPVDPGIEQSQSHAAA